MTAKTSTERVQARRKRMKESGMKELTNIWVPIEREAEIKKIIAKALKDT